MREEVFRGTRVSKTTTSTFVETPEKLIRQEKRDARDQVDRITSRKKRGSPYRVQGNSKWLPYYDKFPLVYVIKQDGEGFYGANLHYIKPKRRVKIIQRLEKGLIDIPRTLVHKYLYNHCESKFLDLAIDEWETSIFLPVEDFIMTRGSGRLPYDRELVWKETETKYDDRIKAQRIIKVMANNQTRNGNAMPANIQKLGTIPQIQAIF